MTSAVLALADLERFDPRPTAQGDETRFCCPLPGPCQGKRISLGHQSLKANTRTGLWTCHRCHASGKLVEFREQRSFPNYQPDRRRSRKVVRRNFSMPPLGDQDAPVETKELHGLLEGILPLAGSPGESYLESRGIPLAVARAAQVMFHPHWYRDEAKRRPGRPAVIFPVRDRSGLLVSAQGRCLDDHGRKVLSAKHISRGVFATPGALEAEPRVLVEAPICALTLACEGIPAIAVCGSNLPDWLGWFLALRSVVVATDADEAGDQAAEKWIATLKARGASVARWRPPAKDWNAALEAGEAGR